MHNSDTVEVSSTPALLWMWERRFHNMVAFLPVFSKFRCFKIIYIPQLYVFVFHSFFILFLFRIWKSFNQWKINVRNNKNSFSKYAISLYNYILNFIILKHQICLIFASLVFFRITMYKNLFCANEVLQGCVIHVRSMCETACSSHTGLGTVSFLCVERGKTYTLDDFVAHHTEQAKHVYELLSTLREKVVEIVFESCAVSMTMICFF